MNSIRKKVEEQFELDRLRVWTCEMLGWEHSYNGWFVETDIGNIRGFAPECNINHTWFVVEKMERLGMWLSLHTPIQPNGKYTATFRPHGKLFPQYLESDVSKEIAILKAARLYLTSG